MSLLCQAKQTAFVLYLLGFNTSNAIWGDDPYRGLILLYVRCWQLLSIHIEDEHIIREQHDAMAHCVKVNVSSCLEDRKRNCTSMG